MKKVRKYQKSVRISAWNIGCLDCVISEELMERMLTQKQAMCREPLVTGFYM